MSSSSISLGTSVDLRSSLASKSYSKDDLGAAELVNKRALIEKRHKSPERIGRIPKAPSFGPSWKLDKMASRSLKFGGDANVDTLKDVNFYQEVDERMSCNSFEYPQQQAQHVAKWLDNYEPSAFTSPRSVDNDSLIGEDDWGNVIGIRGFRTPTKVERDIVEGRKKRNAHNKLRFEHSKLQSDYEKLRARLESSTAKWERMLKRKDHDIELLRAASIKRLEQAADSAEGGSKNQCCARGHNDNEQRQGVELELKVVANKEDKLLKVLRDENEQLRREADRKEAEFESQLRRLRKEIEMLSLEPNNRALIGLRNENIRLKESRELDEIEFDGLKGDFTQLRMQMKSILNDQQSLSGKKEEEISKIFTELCRLQVYQPKLESTLEIERAINQELRGKIGKLDEQVANLNEQLENETAKLNSERANCKKFDGIELERIQGELIRWREKFYQLQRDKWELEEMLRNLRYKMSQMDAQHQVKIGQLTESNSGEMKRLSNEIIRLEEDQRKNSLSLEEMSEKLNQLEGERDKLNRQNLDLITKLETMETLKDDNYKRFKECEQKVVEFGEQLQEMERKNRELVGERESSRQLVEGNQGELEQMKQRFELQQKAYAELRERKDKELARLRVNLNLEQYNRQMALKGVEKELRASLRELEAMKYRFSFRSASASASRTDSESSNRFQEKNGGKKLGPPAARINTFAKDDKEKKQDEARR